MEKFETDSIMSMQRKAKLRLKRPIGNELLALDAEAENAPMYECQFQPEQRIVRFRTDIAGDSEKKKFMDDNKNVLARGAIV